MGITEIITAPRSPWQNPYAERLIGSIRENAWITSSSSTSVTYAASCRAIFNTTTTPERISRFARTARDPVPFNLPRLATSLPSRRLAVCTIAMSVEPLEESRMFLLAPIQLPSGQF
jgi:hypothetical protein